MNKELILIFLSLINLNDNPKLWIYYSDDKKLFTEICNYNNRQDMIFEKNDIKRLNGILLRSNLKSIPIRMFKENTLISVLLFSNGSKQIVDFDYVDDKTFCGSEISDKINVHNQEVKIVRKLTKAIYAFFESNGKVVVIILTILVCILKIIYYFFLIIKK